MLKKYLKYIFITLVLFGATFAAVDRFAKHEYLNFLARYYFDEKYYLAEYPEVKDSGMSAYDHYMQIGWKENKNPNAEFDTKFYKVYNDLESNKYHLNPLEHYVYGKIKFRNYLIKPKKVTLLENPKYYLSLVALFRDEARFLKEWIEFYRMVGVEHFYLYNHLSQDNYMEVLQPYIDQGVVELTTLTKEPSNEKEWYEIQNGSYTNTIRNCADETEWLMVVDTDEFFFPVKEYSLANALKAYDQYAALSVNWRVFGSRDIQRIPDDQLMIETLRHKREFVSEPLLVKTIVKPRYVNKYIDPHYPVLKQGHLQINENFEYFHGSVIPKNIESVFTLNHYWARDLDFFYKNKINRVHLGYSGLKAEEDINKKKQGLLDRNQLFSTTYDEAILKYVPELRKRVFGEESK